MEQVRSLKADVGILFLWCWGCEIASFVARGKLSIFEALGAALGIWAFGLLFLIGRKAYHNRLSSAVWATGFLALASAVGNFRA